MKTNQITNTTSSKRNGVLKALMFTFMLCLPSLSFANWTTQSGVDRTQVPEQFNAGYSTDDEQVVSLVKSGETVTATVNIDGVKVDGNAFEIGTTSDNKIAIRFKLACDEGVEKPYCGSQVLAESDQSMPSLIKDITNPEALITRDSKSISSNSVKIKPFAYDPDSGSLSDKETDNPDVRFDLTAGENNQFTVAIACSELVFKKDSGRDGCSRYFCPADQDCSETGDDPADTDGKLGDSQGAIELLLPPQLRPNDDVNGPPVSEGVMSGSRYFKGCQKIATSSLKWGEAVKRKPEVIQDSVYTASWKKLFDEQAKTVKAALSETEVAALKGDDVAAKKVAIGKLGEALKAAIDEGGSHFKELASCSGLTRVVTEEENYKDEELKKAGNENLTKKSMDGKIECKAAGPETQDWAACKTLITTYNAAAVGQVVTEEAQKLDYMDKDLETQTDLMADGGKDPTKALKSQESMVRKQAQIANQRAAFHGAKLAALLAAKNAMPTREQMESRCSGSSIKTDLAIAKIQYHAYVSAFVYYGKELVGDAKPTYETVSETTSSEILRIQIPTSFRDAQKGAPSATPDVTWYKKLPMTDPKVEEWGPSDGGEDKAIASVDNVCNEAVYGANSGNRDSNVIMNSEAIEQANMAMVQAGVDMAANVAKGQILDNQADRIADAADGIKNFDPGELPMFQEEDAQVTACQADPTSAECLELENTRGVGYAGSSFNFNGASRATTDGQIADDSDGSGDSSASSDKSDRSGVKTPMGRAIASINKGGGLDGIAGKAGVKKGGNPAAAGGGGGGGAGGAAPPSGGGVRGGGGAGGARSAYKASKVRYRGGAGGLSFSGSGKGNSRSKKKSANPFASLLGKKKGGKGGTLNFRNPASIGAKGGSLFQMISKRYSVVSEKKQLLEYEDVK